MSMTCMLCVRLMCEIAPKAKFMQCTVPILEDRPSPQGRVDLRGNCST